MNIFTRTINRLFSYIYLFNPTKWLPLLIDGISAEFNRLKAFRDDVHKATIPSDEMPEFAIEDYEQMYGISGIGGTTKERIARIKERADLNGLPGKDWLERQIRGAGFDLYVVENLPQLTNNIQYGLTLQYGPTIQYGLQSRFIDVTTIPGELIVNSPPCGAGKLYVSQYSPSQQYGNGFQYGTPDLTVTTPIARRYERTTDASRFGFYFFLSPFMDIPASNESAFLEVTQEQFNYLRKIIISSRLMKNWCIAQVKVV